MTTRLMMQAQQLTRFSDLNTEDNPLSLVQVPVPTPAEHEVLVRVAACGVCHTELDEIEGRTRPPKLPIIPGHEVVGTIEQVGTNVSASRLGQRVGIGWIHSSDGTQQENVSPDFCATGRDVDGGYAEYMTVPADYAHPIPSLYSDTEAAPLLCAGAIGFRALSLTGLVNGQKLGLTGFGGSAHLVLQLCHYLYPDSPVCVFARDESSRAFALALGATWSGGIDQQAPEALDAIIDTTPAWNPVIEAIRNLAPCGRLVINAIRKEDADKTQLQRLTYQDIWLEREIKTVANITGYDIASFLAVAAKVPIRPTVEVYPLSDANKALVALKRHPVQGAKVLKIS